MTSPDAVTWTSLDSGVSALDGCHFGNGLFILKNSDTFVTSSDGISWASVSSPDNNSWSSITYGNGLFVAVSSAGTKRVATSADGVVWSTIDVGDDLWKSVAYGNGQFVATAYWGTYRVMTSPDGITWTRIVAPQDNQWNNVIYGNGKFVAVSSDGVNRVMTSGEIESPSTTVLESDLDINGVLEISTNSTLVAGSRSIAIAGDWGIDGAYSPMTSTVTFDGASNQNIFGNNTFYNLGSTGGNKTLGFEEAMETTILTGGSLSLIGESGNNLLLRSVDASGVVGNTQSTINVVDGAVAITANFIDVRDHVLKDNGITGLSLGFENADKVNSGNNDIWLEVLIGVWAGGGVDNLWSNPANWSDNVVPSKTTDVKFGDYAGGGNTSKAVIIDIDVSIASLTIDASYTANIDAATNNPAVTIAGVTTADGTGTLLLGDGIWIFQGDTDLADMSVDPGLGTVSVSASNFIGSASNLNNIEFTGIGSLDLESWEEAEAVTGGYWTNLAYGNGLYVALSGSTGDAVNLITSSDGKNWVDQLPVDANSWTGITYGNGMFVAVSEDGANRVMSSSDGISWVAHIAPGSYAWQTVTYGNGLFVAIAEYSTAVMTSTDGVNWTEQTGTTNRAWSKVVYGNGKFVAVSTGSDVMVSVDGVTWNANTGNSASYGLAYGDGLFVAVGSSRIQSSPDGINWTSRAAPESKFYINVAYANGLWVAVTTNGSSDIITSVDGITWDGSTYLAGSGWYNITYGANGGWVCGSYKTTASILNADFVYTAQETNLNSNLKLNGNLTVKNTSTLSSVNNSIEIKGDWYKFGTFNAGVTSVLFNGTADQNIFGNNAFYNLSSTGGSKTLGFEEAMETTILTGGSLDFIGESGNNLLLRSVNASGVVGTTQTTINVVDGAAAITANFIDIRDHIIQDNGTPDLFYAIEDTDHVNSGNNTIWFLSQPQGIWDGGGSDNLWSTPENWTNDMVPSASMGV